MQQYELSKVELKEIQNIQLEMLHEIDRICRNHNIRYNIIAGTLLGAVRHKGYIPWDDDADVALFREEYVKFREACEKTLDHSKYYFQDSTNTVGYRWGYGKLRRKDSLFLRENQEHMPYEQGIFVDVFPLDNVPQKKLKRELHNFHCFCIRKIMWSPVGKLDEKNCIKRLGYCLLAMVPERKLIQHYEKFISKSNRTDSEWVRILTFPTPTKDHGYRRCWYEESIQFEFENQLLYGIKEWDDYLHFKFGNYLEIPAPEEQKVHAITALRLPKA